MQAVSWLASVRTCCTDNISWSSAYFFFVFSVPPNGKINNVCNLSVKAMKRKKIHKSLWAYVKILLSMIFQKHIPSKYGGMTVQSRSPEHQTTMFGLTLLIGNNRLWKRDGLQCQGIHTEFHENQSCHSDITVSQILEHQ